MDTTIALLTALLAFPLALGLTRFLMAYNFRKGVAGIDVHKLDKPRIPEMCGASIPISLVVIALAEAWIDPDFTLPLVAFASVVGSTALVGAIDDRVGMRGRYKPALALLCGLPILVLGYYNPGLVFSSTLRVPLFGSFHLPIIYPLAIPVAISVTS